MNLNKVNYRLSLVLWMATIHSALLGLGLMAISPSWIRALGLQINGERFFQAQGGAFHLVMAAIYAWAAVRTLRRRELIILAIVVKSTAALFLAAYCLFVHMIWIVLASAAVDASIAALIYCTLVDCERERLQRLGEIH